jgi:hypothetical protein
VPRADEGFQSEELRAALKAALAGRPAELERLLARMGAVVTTRPNLRLAAAFGTEAATASAAVLPLLRRLAADDAAPDTDRAFLPMAAAHGWSARLRAGRDVEEAWSALCELAADERAPVRLGTRDALLVVALLEGGGDRLVERAVDWLETQAEDRELCFGTASMALELLGDRKVQAGVRNHAALLDYLSRVIEAVAEAPRSSERSEARRRLLAALPRTIALVIAGSTHGQEAHAWFQGESALAQQPVVRAALSDALIMVRSPTFGQSDAKVHELRRALEDSAKPLRDPSRLRPGTGRGKATRRTR